MATYKLKRDVKRKYYWILKSDKNHEIIAMSSEAYESKQAATDSIAWVRAHAEEAKYLDETMV